jgi:hypothetical protein
MRIMAVEKRTLEDLLESLTIEYHFDELTRTLGFVCDYRHKKPGSSRAFLRMSFAEVSSFRRTMGALADYEQFTTSYNARASRGTIVVQAVTASLDERPNHLELSFGSSFGKISFSFGSVLASVRDTYATKVDTEWQYSDFETGEPIDFYSPFGVA